jgi:hypothetical protein
MTGARERFAGLPAKTGRRYSHCLRYLRITCDPVRRDNRRSSEPIFPITCGLPANACDACDPLREQASIAGNQAQERNTRQLRTAASGSGAPNE